jgi:hypothetical protein
VRRVFDAGLARNDRRSGYADERQDDGKRYPVEIEAGATVMRAEKEP